ncbi:MAG: type II toxin-antitoxin system Phd/YefM family antitoxin [Thermoanaerobaculia bacterium]|nr:type II toxin-antitoxin system Phd/YefM family antitoxin [Thermoanaerobaculia bacterium]
MKTVAISKFKAECLAILESVRRTNQPVLVTRFGEPVAEVIAPRESKRPKSWLGRYRTEGKILGDVVAPAAEENEWEALGQ